jgi:hypothetical protein
LCKMTCSAVAGTLVEIQLTGHLQIHRANAALLNRFGDILSFMSLQAGEQCAQVAMVLACD